MRILLKYPSRSRPELFKRRVENWQSLASGEHPLHWLCSFDADDASMNNDATKTFCRERGIEHYYGDSKTKVEAINADIDKTDFEWDVLALVSDDFAALGKHWDRHIAEDLGGRSDRAIWYPDGNQMRVCTLVIMGREIYRSWGFVYHPGYKSVYCDNYYQLLLQREARLKFVKKYIFQHQWKVDELVRRNEVPAIYEADKALFARHQSELPKDF